MHKSSGFEWKADETKGASLDCSTILSPHRPHDSRDRSGPSGVLGARGSRPCTLSSTGSRCSVRLSHTTCTLRVCTDED